MIEYQKAVAGSDGKIAIVLEDTEYVLTIDEATELVQDLSFVLQDLETYQTVN